MTKTTETKTTFRSLLQDITCERHYNLAEANLALVEALEDGAITLEQGLQLEKFAGTKYAA